MFALRSHAGGGRGEASFVLPRWLRRPARMLERARLWQMEPPPFAATMASGVLLGLAVLYGTVQGGHTETVLQAVTARVGFAVEHVEVTGNNHVSEIDVLQQIGLDGWTSMIGFSARAARERIGELPWVESATVRKVYPSTLAVEIVERTPFALWQRGSRLAVIEADGSVIAPFTGGRLAALPLVIGLGANEAGPDFIEKVSRVRGLSGRVRAYIRVADRRWDLRLDNGITIKLPEEGVEAAMAEASRLDAEYALFARDVTAIDLRVPDRLTVALSPEAEEGRDSSFGNWLAERRRGARI